MQTVQNMNNSQSLVAHARAKPVVVVSIPLEPTVGFSQDKRAVERLSLEKAFHPFIAGAFNKVVQEIMQETGARINIPPPSVNKDEIIITGEKEPVAQALLRIRKIYEDKVSRVWGAALRGSPAESS